MYAKGVRCSNCYEPHSGGLRAALNAVCTQCHGPAGNADFPSLPLADYDSPAHHFHEPGTEGAQCKNCHMAERVYMGVDGWRDHSFRIPRPDLSVLAGTPNACTDCHAGQSADWAAAELAARFPNSTRRGPHFAAAYAAAWNGSNDSGTADLLIEIASNRDLPGIVRASALETLTRYGSPEIADRTEILVRDKDALIRAAAIPLQMAKPPANRLERIAPLLKDVYRAVRIEAARAVLNLSDVRVLPQTAQSVRSAMLDYQQSLLAKADFPEWQMAIAGTALTLREFRAAEAAFEEAARLDPQLIDAWVMIARLRAAQGDPIGAEEAARYGLRLNPDSAPLTQLLHAIQSSKETK